MGNSRYFLMFEDIQAAAFTVSYEENAVLDTVLNRNCAEYLPVGVSDGKQLKNWILNRGIPVTRDGISRDLSESGVSAFQLMLLNYGLSLTDHYWFCSMEEHLDWKSVNLYENPFCSFYSLDIQDDIPSILSKTNFVPSASLKGDLKKKWIIDQDGVRRLVKGNYGGTCRQSLCEVLASEIHRRQKACHTPYRLIKISSNGSEVIGCECPNFTGIETEFVPAADIIGNEKKPNDMSWYEFYILACACHGLDIRDFMEYQILSDFVISNTDRHLNNFGILRRTDNLSWLGMAPIFDSGNSMFHQSSHIPSGKELLEIGVTSFYDKEVKLLKRVRNRGILDLSKLPDDAYLYDLLRRDMAIKDEVNEKLVKAYHRKIMFLKDFQNGADLWDYNYRKHCGVCKNV